MAFLVLVVAPGLVKMDLAVLVEFVLTVVLVPLLVALPYHHYSAEGYRFAFEGTCACRIVMILVIRRAAALILTKYLTQN